MFQRRLAVKRGLERAEAVFGHVADPSLARKHLISLRPIKKRLFDARRVLVWLCGIWF
jgi:hypothetical protein